MPTVRREHPPVTITCSHLYETDTTFRLLVDEWVRERRCPLPLVDRCLEFGLDAAAEAARWAATEPELKEEAEWGELTGPYPGQKVHNHWWWICRSDEMTRARDVPSGRLNDHCRKDADPPTHTPPKNTTEAILWLLDNWVPE